MFNSPLEYCTVCRVYVALDQSQFECARVHNCSPDQPCPLVHLFSAGAAAAVRERSGDAPVSTTRTGTPAPKP